MKLFDKFFPDRAELEAVKAERDRLTEQVDMLERSATDARAQYAEQLRVNQSLRDDLRHTKEKIREQNSADLLLIFQRLTAKILEGEQPTQGEGA